MRRLGLCLLLAATQAVAKQAQADLLELVARADLVVHGRVVELRDDTAVVAVLRAWKQDLGTDAITVAPTTIQHCIGVSPNLRVGEEVVLLLGEPEGGCYRVLAEGQGKIAVHAEQRAETLEAVARLVEIASLDEDGQNRAMLALATSGNAMLRRQSHEHIGGRISHSKLRESYRKQMVALLEAADPEARQAALLGLRFVKAPEAVHAMITLTRDPTVGVVQAASLALAQYDTPATVNALVALTGQENVHVRTRAIIDLQNSRSPKALAALLSLLDDADAAIRKLACGRLVGWMRRGEHLGFEARLDRLILFDPDEEVRAEAARVAWEARDPVFVRPLVAALREAPAGGRLERACLESLHLIQNYGGEEGKREVEAHMQLYVRSLRRGTGGMAPVELLYFAKRADELRWAAERHPDPAVREHAARCFRFLTER